MSITFAMTALAARDHIQNDVADLSNYMCLFILTNGEGTLFNASSILEKDIIKICIQLGHTHPEGVLWYSTIKSVMLFHTADELQIAVHGVVKTLMLHDEAIRIRTFPPSATHVRAYMVAVDGNYLAPTLYPPVGRRNPIYFLATPTLVGEPHNTCKQTLGILQIMNCASSWRISAGRLHTES